MQYWRRAVQVKNIDLSSHIEFTLRKTFHMILIVISILDRFKRTKMYTDYDVELYDFVISIMDFLIVSYFNCHIRFFFLEQ